MTITQNFILLGFLGLVTVANWVCAAARWMKAYYVTKVIVILTLLFFFYTQGGTAPHRLWFFVGLFFSVLGDIFLISKNKRWFMAGMAAFFVTQVCYIIGFNQQLPEPAYLGAGLLLAAVIIWLYFSYIDRKLVEKPEYYKGRNLFKAYSAAVVLMAVSALLCLFRPGWYGIPRGIVAFGGILFLVSDTLIGLERLGKRIPSVRFWVILTYHLAQYLIVLAVASH